MKKNLTAVKNFAKKHRNEIIAYSVGAGHNAMRYDTSYGHFIIRGLNHEM